MVSETPPPSEIVLDWDSDQIISASASDQLIMIDVLAEPPNLKLVRVRIGVPFVVDGALGRGVEMVGF